VEEPQAVEEEASNEKIVDKDHSLVSPDVGKL